MPISTVCSDCQEEYTVEDDMAGKRFRCHECQSIITVPGTLVEEYEGDPLSEVDLEIDEEPIRNPRRVEVENDSSDSADESNPYRAPQADLTPVKQDGARVSFIPVTAIVAIILQSLLTLFPAISCILILLGNQRDTNQKIGSCGGLMIRFAIALFVLRGMFRRQRSARQWSRGLCSLGLVVIGLALVMVIATGVQTAKLHATVISLSGQCVIWLTMILCLSTESAEDWFDE